MTHLMVCRVCLAYDIRLHSISGCQLQDIYEKFTETSLETGDMKPTCVCYICFSLLKKFQKFIEKSKKSDQLLEQMINSGLELSVNSLELFCKQQTEFPWTLDKSPMVRVISATEEEVNVETPIKTEYVNSEMDVGDQNDEDDLDGITLELEVTNQDSSDSEDNLPLQNISKQWKADQSNVSEMKTTKILNPDAREIILSKEEQLQQMLERSKSLNYQNSLIEFVDTKAFENHQEKHEVLQLTKKRKSDKVTENEILKSQALIPNNEKTTSNINNDINNSKTKANSNEQVAAPNNIYIWDVCKKEYLCKSYLKKHIKKWHIGDEQNCKNTNLSVGKDVLTNKKVRENKLSKNKNQHKDSICSDETQYKCSYCMKCFSDGSTLATHVRTHTGEKPHKCSDCTKCFTTNGELANHVRIHTGEKPFKCSYCKKCFTQRGHLDTHVRIHTGEKPYKCSYCTKYFTQSCTLTKHIRTHTGKKPYKCSYCTKCFTQSYALTKHVRTHTGEKPYKCNYCTKCFTSSSDLATHVRTHTGEKPYKCSYCIKCFTCSSALVTHIRTHTGEQPYKCSYCTKCFNQSIHLATHIRIHTGEKPYKCSHCTKCFSESSALAKHVRSHTLELDITI